MQQVRSQSNAGMVPTWLQIALQNLQSERLTQAKALYEQVLDVSPKHPDALQWLGVIAHKQGNSAQAIVFLNDAITQRPTNAFYYSTLGNVLRDMTHFDSAIASYKKAISIKPDFAEAHNNLGIVYGLVGQLEQAIACYQLAIKIYPAYAEAHNNLGYALGQLQKPDAAAACRRAIELNPAYAEAHFNLATVLTKDEPERAIDLLVQAVRLKADMDVAWYTLGQLFSRQGNLTGARQCFDKYLTLKPAQGIRVVRDLQLPVIMGTSEDVRQTRERFETNLEQLRMDRVTLQDPVAEFCGTNFHLAYHGLNDREVQIKISNFYGQACPELLFVAPHCSVPRPQAAQKRIGFVSKFIATHSVALSFSGIVQGMADRHNFEIALISTSDPQDVRIQQTYPGFKGQHVRLHSTLAEAREQLALLKLDVLVYLDIGMDAFTYFLAFSRLARVQCVAGGHPVTTGIAAMDYFVSSKLAETADADSHYSEKLVRLPFGMFYFPRPTVPDVFKDRAELGLPKNGRIYLCPLTLFKLHPDFDVALSRILELDSEGQVILVSDKKFNNWQTLLEARFARTIPATVRGRITFLPWVINPQDFICLNKAADVVLDSFHFGLGTTAIAICSVGTPFVTKPSEFLRGRVGLLFSKILDVMECVAEDCEDYAQKAVAIANDQELRQRIQSKILTNNHLLFENEQAITDMVEFLRVV